jgi:hypothetical protein
MLALAPPHKDLQLVKASDHSAPLETARSKEILKVTRFHMKKMGLLLNVFVAFGFASAAVLFAEEPIIPPSIEAVWPQGMERGTTATFSVDGRNLSGVKEVLFDVPGLAGKVSDIFDVPEKIMGPRAGVDLSAQVPLGKKQSAALTIVAAKNVVPGIHYFRFLTPLGTSDRVALAIGELPEVHANEVIGATGGKEPRKVTLPATLVGTIQAPGDEDRYEFEVKSGEEFVFQVIGSVIGSRLDSELILSDTAGGVLTQAGEFATRPDAVLTYKFPGDGEYILSVADRLKEGGKDHYYRVNAGPLPYITHAFPLGVQAGKTAEVSIDGVNLGTDYAIKVTSPEHTEGWETVPISLSTPFGPVINEVNLAVEDEPEILEKEPNNLPVQAQLVTLPIAIDGHIDGHQKAEAKPDEDYFRFHGHKGETVTIDVAASRLGSPLDSVIEVLDEDGRAIPRATVRCLNQTTTTLADRDSRDPGIRLTSTSEIHVGDYMMIGDELDQVGFIPDQPDADVIMRSFDGLRRAFMGTSPDFHAVNTFAYRAEVLPPDAQFPSNGLPVFHLTWRNDDGGPGYGPDSRLDFVVPKDGDYLVHLKDVRGLEGADFSYLLALHDLEPDYQLASSPENPNVPQGGSMPVTVTVNRTRGYEGPIEIGVEGLPAGLSATHAVIPQGQDSTVVILAAKSDVPLDLQPAKIKIVGKGHANGHDIVRVANPDSPLQLAAIMPPPDVVVTTDPVNVSLEPGQEIKVTLHVERKNGFKGRVPCTIQNLPSGVKVVNVGLNGVLVTEGQTSRTFTLRAEDWAKPIGQPIFVVAEVESNSPTMHPSPPLMVSVMGKGKMANSARNQTQRVGEENGASGPVPNR